MPHDEEATGRRIELSVEVAGTPEEVWDAIATGPGISSWYVPTTVEEHVDGRTTSDFGAGPGNEVIGRVTAWEPPTRVAFTGTDGVLAFEWLVEARDGGTCVVRLVNSGFLDGPEWDAMYDGLSEGWLLFLENLRLHRAHFPGRRGWPMLPTTVWDQPAPDAWRGLLDGLGLPPDLSVGATVRAGTGCPPLAGTVLGSAPLRASLLLDEPSPGTAFLAAERMGEATAVSVWCYLYGDDPAGTVERDGPRWAAWLAAHGPS